MVRRSPAIRCAARGLREADFLIQAPCSRTRTLTCIFHEGGTVCHVIAKRINLIRRLLGIVSQGQFVPIHFQEKCYVTV
jgi:hypothetical protein